MKVLLTLLLLVGSASAQSLQQIQPGDSLEQRRQKENSNFTLLNSKITAAVSSAHTHANKSAIDTIPGTFATAYQYLRLNSSHTSFEFATLIAGDGITISHAAGITTISANLGNGINSLNGLTGSTQTFVNDNNVVINSSGSAHTLGFTGTLGSSRGGTGNGFTKFAGPASAEKTFTLPNQSAVILTDAAAVTVAQGGTGAASLTGLLVGNGTSAFTTKTAPSGNVVGDTDSQTLSSKTLASPDVTSFAQYLAQAETRYRAASGSNYVGFRAPNSLSGNTIFDLPAADGTLNQMICTDGSKHLSFCTPPGASGGEANTASNQGTGAGWFKTKSGVDLQFKSLVTTSKLSVTSNTNDLTLDVVEANLSHANIGGVTPVSKGGSGQASLSGIVIGNGTLPMTTVAAPTSAVVGVDDTQTLTHKTIDSEATGNTITLTSKVWLDAAGCENATAYANWDVPTSNTPTAACVTGTNIQKGVLDFPDGAVDLAVQRTIALPADFTGSVDVIFKWFSPATSGNVVLGIATACAGDGALDDPTFNNFNDVTDIAKGTANQLNDASITGISTSGCSGGKLMHLKIARRLSQSADTMANTLRLVGVELTLRRAQ